jgi:DNA-binding transcriptional LysR family regulator
MAPSFIACHTRLTVRFDITTLKLLVSAIDQGSIARAADCEHMVASAASKRIGDLETGLGVLLLVRQHGGVVPTAAGEALARNAREVIRTLDGIPGALNTLALNDQPDIRILANQTATVVMVADLASYIAARPGLKIRLEEGHSLSIIESVAQGNAHIGVIGHYQPTDRLHVVPYRSMPLMLVVPASHPFAGRTCISFADALEFDLITLMEGTAIRAWALAAAARMARKPKFTIQVQTYEAMRAMVQAGLGIAVMPAANILPYETLLHVRALPLTDDWARMQLYVVCDRHALGIPAVEQLLAHLSEP